MEDEWWATRIWHARQAVLVLKHRFYTRSLHETKPALWASDAPNTADPTISPAVSGNQNLVQFFQKSCLLESSVARLEDLQRLNNGLRERARSSLISYITALDRVSLPDGTVASTPDDVSALLLQNTDVPLCDHSSRIENAICSIQIFIHRTQVGLESTVQIPPDFWKKWKKMNTFENWEAHQRRILYSENWIQWEEMKIARKSEAFRFLEKELKRNTLTMPIPDISLGWQNDPNTLPLGVLDPIQSADFAVLNTQVLPSSSPTGVNENSQLIGQPDQGGEPSWLVSVQFTLPTPGEGSSQNPPVTESLSQRIEVHGTNATEKPSLKKATTVGPQSDQYPLWFQAAINLGTDFVRVAAAGIPPGFSTASDDTADALHDVMDEYYFWIVVGDRWDPNSIPTPQNPDTLGSDSAPPVGLPNSTSSWDNPDEVPGLLEWPADPRVHLYWTRVHLGVFQPPRRSEQGMWIPSNTAVALEFNGRGVDSLYFQIDASNPADGFRYDIATDTAVVVPAQQATATAPSSGTGTSGSGPSGSESPPAAPSVNPNVTPYKFPDSVALPLISYPYFVEFEPGAPIVPVSPFSTTLAVVRALRAQSRFADALQWCRGAFDVRQNSNVWAQCPPSPSTAAADDTNIVTSSTQNAATAEVGAQAEGGGEVNNNDIKRDRIPIESVVLDIPCCPTAGVGSGIARARAVVLEYVEILLDWAETLLCGRSIDEYHHAMFLLKEAHRILGDQPPRVYSQDRGIGAALTVATYQSLSAPLNPHLLKLYDRVATLHSITQCIDSSGRTTARKPGVLRNLCCDLDSGCLSCYQPYRFFSVLPKALEITSLVKSLGSQLLSAYEKGDGEYLAALRQSHERHLLDLGLDIHKLRWRESDWQVQALQETMALTLQKSRFYQNLLSTGLIGYENDFVSSQQNAISTQTSAAASNSISQAMNIIPDLWFGVAGLGPYNATQIPLGTKLATMFSAEASMLVNTAQSAMSNGGLSLQEAGWQRRAQEWQQQVNLAAIEVEQIKCQIYAADRRRDVSLQELNNYQQQMEQAKEAQDFMRDKFTKQELYLFLQHETAGLYRQAYELAYTNAKQVQLAFRFERAVSESVDRLPSPRWNNFREGLMAGDQLELALRRMEKRYMDLNVREHELTKHISLMQDFPSAFLHLKLFGWTTLAIDEWRFDTDYPGHYLRRIKNVSLTLPCIVGPYIGVHCRLRLLNSSIRLDPLLAEPVQCCCNKKEHDHKPAYNVQKGRGREHDKREGRGEGGMLKRFESVEAIATSSGQSDSGLFELSLHEDRYVPFEFHGAVSAWHLELPPENNQFDLRTLTDVVMHLNYTSREGAAEGRRRAEKRARGNLPGGGVRYFDLRYDFPDLFAKLVEGEVRGGVRREAYGRAGDRRRGGESGWTEVPLVFKRKMFPYLPGRRAVRVTHVQLFIEVDDPHWHHERDHYHEHDQHEHKQAQFSRSESDYFEIQFIPSQTDEKSQSSGKLECIPCIHIPTSAPDDCAPSRKIYCANIRLSNSANIFGDISPVKEGVLKFPHEICGNGTIGEIYMMCEYECVEYGKQCKCERGKVCCCGSKQWDTRSTFF